MEVRLYNEPEVSLTPLQQVLYNRGISVEEQDRWLNAGPEEQYSWKLLDHDRMVKAVNKVHEIINLQKRMAILIDCDDDGFSASSLFLNYFYYREPRYNNIDLVFHDGKQHGFADIMDKIPDDVLLVISPDGGSNDIKQHQELADKGIDVICLDHHDCDIDINDSPANIINVQTCDYPDKDLTGSGVVYKFVQAYDDLIYHDNQYTRFCDLACLGAVGDMADSRELEIRSLVLQGLSNLNNDFIKEMADAHSYTIEKRNGLNYLSVAFGIVPFLNAINRSGTPEEKKTVFKAMCDRWSHDEVSNSKRGHNGETCYLYEEAVTIADRVKRRQSYIEKQEMAICEEKIEDSSLDNNSVILIQLEPDEGEASINGLVANEVQAKYQKPAIVTVRQETDKGVFWSGSMRNYSLSPIIDFKQVINDTGLAEAQGHPSASGFFIADENVKQFLDRMDKVYKNIDQTPVYWVDYDWSMNEVDDRTILDMARFNIYGQGISEGLISVHDIDLSRCRISLLGKMKNTIKVVLPNETAIVFFGQNDVSYNKFCQQDMHISVCGKPNANEWMGNVTPQIIVDDFDIWEEESFYIF